jgi:hypothetical protein
VTVRAPTGRTRGGRARRGRWRLDASGRHARRCGPADGRATEREDFELCLAQLEEAIARAERWLVRRERTLADFDTRAAGMVDRLRRAGVLGPSATWEPARGRRRGMSGRDAAERERAGYVNAMRAANASPYGSWS